MLFKGLTWKTPPASHLFLNMNADLTQESPDSTGN